MTADDRELLELKLLLRAKFEAESGTLRKLASTEQGLKDAIQNLSEQRYRSQDPDLGTAIHAVGVDRAWNSWADSRKRTINIELARVRALMAFQRKAAARAFGRVDAIGAVSDKSRDQAKKEKIRGTYQDINELVTLMQSREDQR